MAALNTIARAEADTIRDGIAWLIVWKTGRSWHAERVYLNIDNDTFEPEDLDMVRKVLEQDPNAVMLNGYYCGHFGEDMTVAEIEAGIRWHYEEGGNLLENSAAFPPEPMERPADLPADIPWYGKETSAEPDPYVYDGYMSVEDFELMHENMAAAEKEEKPPDTMTPELTNSPEQAAAIVEAIRPQLEKVAEHIAQKLQQFAAWAGEILSKVVATVRQNVNDCMNALLYYANDHPKWWHLYKHAKKARTRKKYRRQLMQQLYRKLETAKAQKIARNALESVLRERYIART